MIDYSENDRVTVQNAYYYQDGRCCVEYIEFTDGTKGTLDYANTRLNITSAPTEPEPTDETQIIEMKLSTEQSIEVQPTETELIENTEAIVDSSTDENSDEPISGQEVIQDTTPSEKMDTTVDNCVGILEDLYTLHQPSDEANNVKISSEEQSTAIYDNATNAAIDNIVNLLVQDMSESGTSTLSDSNTITDVNVINDNVQLWVS